MWRFKWIFHRFNALKVQLWIFLSVALVGILLMFILNVLTIQLYQAQNSTADDVYLAAQRQQMFLHQSIDKHLQLWIDNAQFIEKESITKQKLQTQLTFEEIWQKQIFVQRDSLRKLLNKGFDQTAIERYLDIEDKIKKLFTASQRTLKDLENEIPITFLSLDIGQGNNSNEKTLQGFSTVRERLSLQIAPLSAELKDLLWLLDEHLSIQIASQQQLQARQQSYYWALQWVSLLLVVSALFWVRRRIYAYFTKELQKINDFGITLKAGNLPQNLRLYHKELAQTATHLNQVKQSLQNLKNFAENINQPETEQSLKFFSQEGDLDLALQNMKKGLLKQARETENRAWANEGIALFSDLINQNAHNLEQLAHALVVNLSQYLEVNQVGFFVVMEGEQMQADYLEMKAAYAYNRKKYLEKRIELGQGLVGQAWQEGELMYLKTIPKEYVSITSGLGEATPKVLLILPLKANQEIYGIIEMASFHEIEPYKINFLKNIAESIGQAIASLKTNLKTRDLLHDSQALTQDLQQKEEQMRESMLELQDTQARMYRTQRELANKEANLEALINNTSHAILAYDNEYNITVVNKSMRNIYKDLTVGSNLKEILTEEEKQAYWSEYEQALEGKKFEVLRAYTHNNTTIYHERHYNPIINEDKEVIGASVFVEDITEQKLAENRIKRTEANLSSLINDTEDLILALDKDYKLLIFNEVCQEVYLGLGYNIEQGVSIFDYTPFKQAAKWKAFYDRALSGERFVEVIDSGKYPDKTYREFWFNPIRNEEDEVTGLSVFSRDITENKRSEMRVRQLLLESLEATENLKVKEEELRKTITDYETRIKVLELQANSLKD